MSVSGGGHPDWVPADDLKVDVDVGASAVGSEEDVAAGDRAVAGVGQRPPPELRRRGGGREREVGAVFEEELHGWWSSLTPNPTCEGEFWLDQGRFLIFLLKLLLLFSLDPIY